MRIRADYQNVTIFRIGELKRELKANTERHRQLICELERLYGDFNSKDASIPLKSLQLSSRPYTQLVAHFCRIYGQQHITSILDVLLLLEDGPDAIMALPRFGERSLNELLTKLHEKGYIIDPA